MRCWAPGRKRNTDDAYFWTSLEIVPKGVLPELIVRRMRALGFEAVLQVARTQGTVRETWVEGLAAKIRARLPQGS